MGDNLVEQIKKSILAALKELPEETARGIAQQLIDEGISEMEMLKLVREEDLLKSEPNAVTQRKHFLATFQGRKLMHHWQTKTQDNTGHQPQQAMPPTSAVPSTSTVFTTTVNIHTQYIIDWSKLPLNILEKLQSNIEACLKNTEADTIVRLILDDMQATVPHLKKSMFKSVETSMKKKYPTSLASYRQKKKGNELIVPFRIAYKMKNCFDNRNRKQTRTVMEIEQPSIPVACGCIKWALASPPNGETEETLRNKQEELKEIFNQHAKQYNWTRIQELLISTFYLQRNEINTQCSKNRHIKKFSTEELEENWPLLFTYKGITIHFRELTGVHFERKLGEFMNQASLQTLIDYLGKQSEICEKIRAKMYRAADRKLCKDPELLAITTMLVKALDEELDLFLQLVESGTSRRDISRVCVVPKAPCMFARGPSIFRADKWYVSIDGEVRITVTSFAQALITMFSSYFVFNVRYPTKIDKTLDFIQRVVLEINPAEGTRTFSKGKRSGNIDHNLQILMATYKMFNKTVHDESDEDPDNPSETEENLNSDLD